ncbi:MAG TPA: cysteine peptidase family C39 domain-containing protein [Planctomycetota bacterium]|nr:cysteine peptidase family C39 domain-containing protein [Planctomycetota bacterium]
MDTRNLTRAARASHTLLLALLLLGVQGCRSQSLRPTQLSENAVRLDLPLVLQDDLYGCGLASVATLCQYWGVAIPEQERAALAETANQSEGLSGGELLAALRRVGLEVYLFQGTRDRSLTGLYAHVDAGRPLLVMLSPDGEDRHYGLVLGYDEPRGNVILLDPLRGEVLTSVSAFDRDWERCQRFTLLACPSTSSTPEGSIP